MGNLELYDKVRAVPQEAQKRISGGHLNGKTDINPMWRIKTLTEQFGPCGFGWYYEVTDRWLENHGNETAAFVEIELYVKMGDEWSKPIHGTGGSMFVAIQKGKPYVSDECYKMATTDAISVACKQLGIAADIYWSSDRTKYDEESDRTNTGQDSGSPPKSRGQSQPQPRQNASSKISKEQFNEIMRECDRTGYDWHIVCEMCGIEMLSDMNTDQYVYIMSRFKATPDKTPSDDTCGLPFN